MKLWRLLFVLLICVNTIHANWPLKILFVVNFFPRKTETFILNQIIRLIDLGHDVWIHSYLHDMMSLPCAEIVKYALLKRTSYGERCPYDLNSFDILYCQFGPMGNKMLKQKKQTKSNAKLVTCFRGIDITRQLQKYPKTYRDLLLEGDLFLPVCDFFAKILIKLGADPSKVIVHHSAINCKKFSYKTHSRKSNAINIVSISRLVEKKGIEDALNAVALVVKKYPSLHYTIVGDGYLRAKLESLVHKLKLRKHVTFLGSVPHARVESILHAADIFMLPSIKTKRGEQEGIPNVLKEAMACGLAVLSTEHSGIPELVEHGHSGLLSREGDVQDLACNLCYLIEHPDQCSVMGEYGRKKVEESFNIDDLIPRLESYFYALLDR